MVTRVSTVGRNVNRAGCESRRFSCGGRTTPLRRDPGAGRGDGPAPQRALELLAQGYGRRVLLDVPTNAKIYGFTGFS